MTAARVAVAGMSGAVVRRVLYLAALSATRHNPALSAFRDRLAARGKKAKVILTAVARKLLVVANAIIRTGRRWEPVLAMARCGSPRDFRAQTGPRALTRNTVAFLRKFAVPFWALTEVFGRSPRS